MKLHNIKLINNLPPKKQNLIEVWIDLHQDELLADWQLAIELSTLHF